MKGKIRVGIVGTGGMGNAHAKNFKTIKEVELVSCLDVIPEKAKAFAEKWGISKPASSLKELLGKVDAVAVVTPDKYHFGPAMAALQAGKHLLTEKPLTVTLSDALKLRDAAKRASKKGIIHMVNFSYRNASSVDAAASLIKKGSIGELRHVHSFYLQSWLSSTVWGHWTHDWALWRLEKAGGLDGVLGDIGCHILDMTTAVAGNVARIRCHLANFPKYLKDGRKVAQYHGRKLDANDTAIMELEFDNGATGVVQTTRWGTGNVNHLRCEVNGSHGAVRMDLDQSYNEMEVCLGKNLKKGAWEKRKLKPIPSNHQRFVKAILTGRPAQPDVVRGAQIQAYLEACVRSAKSGKWEKIPGSL